MARPFFVPGNFNLSQMLQTLKQWVEVETPSSEAGAVTRLMDVVEAYSNSGGLKTRRLKGKSDAGDMLLVCGNQGGPVVGTLVLAHLDTVHPLGTLDNGFVWRQEGERIEGPGIYDMKAGVLMAIEALKALVAAGDRSAVSILIVPDEEIGSPLSQPVIEDLAKQATKALVVEPARDGGKIVTARKGVASFDVTVHGVASHAGTKPELGRSAIREAAQLIIACEELNDPSTGTTVTVGRIRGGTARNVIPDFCEFEVDVRYRQDASMQKIIDWMEAVEPSIDGVTITVEGGINRPPFSPTNASTLLFDRARGFARQLGLELEGVSSGGGSDGNYAAALGTPTLDGLGADGGGAHTLKEHILTDSLLVRTALLANLMADD